MDGRRQQARELRRQIEWTLARAVDPTDVLPMLHRLVRLADDGSEESVFASMHLAELLVERDPWRAALCARRVLTHRPLDDRAWATLALCQTLLGNYRFAVSAYQHAVGSAPENPWYAHNLGHLLDVALGRAKEALPWLERAYQTAGTSGELAASYAHALARAGHLAQARRVLARAMKRSGSREHAALWKWLEQGAPADKDQPLPRPAAMQSSAGSERAHRGVDAPSSDPVRHVRVRRVISPPSPGQGDRAPEPGAGEARDVGPPSPSLAAGGREVEATAASSRRLPLVLTDLDGVLTRGLASLPLDAKQRARARSLARDAITHFARPSSRSSGGRGGATVQAVAAAVAYAIVYVDHVPLTQSEVAACFRVSVASLRGRFGELRAQLDLLPGDVRYATLRRR